MNALNAIRLWATLIAFSWVGLSSGDEARSAAELRSDPQRVVSMNPSLTRMLLALGAAKIIVGVDEYSATLEPAVAHLPQAGGLFNPSLEAVVALEPDLVVVVPSVQQRDFCARLRELGIDVLELTNLTLDQVLQSLQTLGDRVGRSEAARERIATIRSVWTEVSQQASLRPRRSAVLVVQREPLYVVGGGSYLNAMLDAAGLDNAAAEYPESYPRVSLEWLIATRPQLIIDSSDDPVSALKHWSQWPSIPAVADGRVIAVPEGLVSLPGPYLDRALQTMVAAIRSADEPNILNDESSASKKSGAAEQGAAPR